MGKRPVQRTTRKAAPKDTDGDGLPDAEERRRGTDPRSRDTDRDGMPDDMEVGWKPPTDPTRKDTDGDGLSDWAELMVGSDPTNADTDGDGWRDGYEVGKGSDPTKATSAPSDGDGLTGEDLEAMQMVMQTSPGSVDTDHDGLSDDFERLLGTNPKVPDTDNDGLGDMVEWLRGSNPKSPGRIDPQSNFDLNRVETGKPLPANERRDDPRYGPLGPKRSGKRADAGDGSDADDDVAGLAPAADGDTDALLGAAPIAADDGAPSEPPTAVDDAPVVSDDVALASADLDDVGVPPAMDTTATFEAAPDAPTTALDDGLSVASVDDAFGPDDSLS
jgi:hypothetical protein